MFRNASDKAIVLVCGKDDDAFKMFFHVAPGKTILEPTKQWTLEENKDSPALFCTHTSDKTTVWTWSGSVDTEDTPKA